MLGGLDDLQSNVAIMAAQIVIFVTGKVCTRKEVRWRSQILPSSVLD